MTRVKLIVHSASVANFEQPWIQPLIDSRYELIQYSPDTVYNPKLDVVLATYQTALDAEPWYTDLVRSGHKLILDHLWDSDVDTASAVKDRTLTLRSGNWLWYTSCLEWLHHGYDQYRPDRQYRYSFFMPINKQRPHRDRLVRELADYLDQAVYSYVDRGRELECRTSAIAPWVSRFDPEWYNTTVFSVVAESYMRSRYWAANPAVAYRTEISEKSFKPMAFYHPMIIAGSVDTLAYLRQQGFETYSNLWDESYDTVVEDSVRLDQVIATVKQAVKDYPITWKPDAETLKRLEHNHYRFFDRDRVSAGIKQEVIDTVDRFIAL